MASKDPRVLAVAGALWLGLAASSGTASAQQPTPTPVPAVTPVPTPPAISERVVVSATRLPEEVPEVPASVTVVGGDELRRRGTRTLADALQDVVGLDAGNGSDGGARL
ncbi:MAG TPA: TonB-dependent receptor plug domain-containing protein, partial [Thermoanaerobaculia bacterium]